MSVCLSAPCCTSSYSLEMLSDWKKQKVFCFFFQEGRCPGEIYGNHLKSDSVCQLCLRFSNVNHCIIMQCFVYKGNAFSFDSFKFVVSCGFVQRTEIWQVICKVMVLKWVGQALITRFSAKCASNQLPNVIQSQRCIKRTLTSAQWRLSANIPVVR